jgi:serine/threonine protein kinase
MINPSQFKYEAQANLDFWHSSDLERKLMQSEPTDAPLILQNRWQIVEQLGQGGMGTVYKAYDLRLANRLCVVKKLRIDFFREEDRGKALAFFEREKAVLSSLKHPNIVLVHDYFEELGNYYLVMEYVEGENLQERLLQQGKPFSEPEVTRWASEICDVLVYLHSHNPPVIYRDLKPSNIMLDANGTIKLVDFGIARPYRENTDNTHVVSGGYSPPEQYWGGADPRSDLYALGATMYFLLTGAEPLALQISAPAKINSQLSEKIDRIVQRLTSQEISLRYQTARQAQEALNSKVSRNRYPGSIIAAGVIFCVILVAVLGSFLLSPSNDKVSNSIPDKTFDSARVKHGLLLKHYDRFKHSTKGSSKTLELLAAGEAGKTSDVSAIASANTSPSTLRETKHQSFYSFDLADVDTREEMLTDPEVIQASE